MRTPVAFRMYQVHSLALVTCSLSPAMATVIVKVTVATVTVTGMSTNIMTRDGYGDRDRDDNSDGVR